MVSRGGVHSYGRVSQNRWRMELIFEMLGARQHPHRFRFRPLAVAAEGSPRTACCLRSGCHGEDVVLEREITHSLKGTRRDLEWVSGGARVLTSVAGVHEATTSI